jgi:hypothetical protein
MMVSVPAIAPILSADLFNAFALSKAGVAEDAPAFLRNADTPQRSPLIPETPFGA